MKKFGYTVAALIALTGSAYAADMRARMPLKAPVAPVVISPWDFAFGASITNDYRFRGISQSNRNPSVAAYFEPRYNVNDSLQLYAGVGGASISFPNRASMELDVYGGIRPTFGAFAFDFGVFGYIYPGGSCFNAGAFPGSGIPGSSASCVFNSDPVTGGLPTNGNFIKKDLSFYEVYAKVLWTINDQWALGANAYYSPSFLNSGAEGTYASGTAKFTMPSGFFGASGIGSYISGEYGYQWLGTSDAFYGFTNYKDYSTWNVGIGFTYKVFTLDLRYSDTSLNRGDCNAFTSDQNALFTNSVTPINPGGFGSKWCGATGIVKFSADLTALSNLK